MLSVQVNPMHAFAPKPFKFSGSGTPSMGKNLTFTNRNHRPLAYLIVIITPPSKISLEVSTQEPRDPETQNGDIPMSTFFILTSPHYWANFSTAMNFFHFNSMRCMKYKCVNT